MTRRYGEYLQSKEFETRPHIQACLDVDSYPCLTRAVDSIFYTKDGKGWNSDECRISITEYARVHSKISIWTHLMERSLPDLNETFLAYHPDVSLTDLMDIIKDDDYDRLKTSLRHDDYLSISLEHVILSAIRHRSISILYRILTELKLCNTVRGSIYARIPISILVDIYQYGRVSDTITWGIVRSAMEKGLSIQPYLQLRKSAILSFVITFNDLKFMEINRARGALRYHRNYILEILSDGETASKAQSDVIDFFLSQYPEYARYYEGKERSEAP